MSFSDYYKKFKLEIPIAILLLKIKNKLILIHYLLLLREILPRERNLLSQYSNFLLLQCILSSYWGSIKKKIILQRPYNYYILEFVFYIIYIITFMHKNRLEAYTDAVVAIIVTIMVLEFKIPHEPNRHALQELIPVFISYVMSFVFISIYWNNHHHMLQLANRVNGSVLWANNGLLFFLSLIPFVTGWMAENHFAMIPVMCYGIVLLCCWLSFYVLNKMLLCASDKGERFRSIQSKWHRKTHISILLYFIWILFTFVNPYVAFGMYAFVTLMWLIPSKTIEKLINNDG